MGKFNYPNSFKMFNGKSLDDEEIHEKIIEALFMKTNVLATGDTMVEIDEDNNVTIWKQIAYYSNPNTIAKQERKQ